MGGEWFKVSDAAEKPKDMGTRKLLPFRDVDVIGGLGKSSVGSTILRKDMFQGKL